MSDMTTTSLRENLRDLLEQKRNSGPSGLLSFYQDVEENLRKHYPSSLFRYRTCSANHIEALRQRQIWLSYPVAFNDPYDVLVFFDIAAKVHELRESNGTIAERLGALFGGMANDAESCELQKKIVAEINNLPSDLKRKSEEKLKKEICKLEATCSEFSNEFRRILREDSHLRIACFSETVTNPPMWAHYSDNGKGFAIEYKTNFLRSICHKNATNKICVSKSCPDFQTNCRNRYAGHLFPVIYSNQRYDFSAAAWKIFLAIVISSASPEDRMKLSSAAMSEDSTIYHKLSLIKSEAWRYENEWRVVAQAPGAENHISFICDPVAVYLGTNIDPKDKREILEIVAYNNQTYDGHKVSVYMMKVNFQNKNNELEVGEKLC